MISTAIVLFARSPEREAAAKRIGSAAPLFRAVIAAWLREAHSCGATPVVACSAMDRAALASIAPEIERQWIEQRGATFGERVVSATDDAFARGFDAVIVAAIDAPPRDLREALAALERGVPVVAPSRDGGINYIGLIAPEPELLKQLEPRRRDLLDVCKRYFERIYVMRGAIDLDSNDALALARRDRAWRALLPALITVQPRNCAPAQPGVNHPYESRPPPAL